MSFNAGCLGHIELFEGFWEAIDNGYSENVAVEAAIRNLQYTYVHMPNYQDVVSIAYGKTARSRKHLWRQLSERGLTRKLKGKYAESKSSEDPELIRKAAVYDELKALGLLEQMGIEE